MLSGTGHARKWGRGLRELLDILDAPAGDADPGVGVGRYRRDSV